MINCCTTEESGCSRGKFYKGGFGTLFGGASVMSIVTGIIASDTYSPVFYTAGVVSAIGVGIVLKFIPEKQFEEQVDQLSITVQKAADLIKGDDLEAIIKKIEKTDESSDAHLKELLPLITTVKDQYIAAQNIVAKEKQTVRELTDLNKEYLVTVQSFTTLLDQIHREEGAINKTLIIFKQQVNQLLGIDDDLEEVQELISDRDEDNRDLESLSQQMTQLVGESNTILLARTKKISELQTQVARFELIKDQLSDVGDNLEDILEAIRIEKEALKADRIEVDRRTAQLAEKFEEFKTLKKTKKKKTKTDIPV
ncbi:hypothetical protein N9Y92_03620 [Chlamydiales bacterium]|nr:hypothetical protein [Chlamydiales bacterium]